ncbi:putative thiol-disulfide oxidoreductase [Gordonia araii NBRC 100433]|uniref:Putative thiol-disulfide oxidoreductase n=1 Tax=Gordonia araii NBRC 100433 TaxID=1073574 RepID=G7GYY1_9ACTN|nr:thioredoxin domain-containing protein [Gordonia araii]NNG97016.1 thioredoxin domain-containing protein [Gordonia araii NBRC 100433]GAB08806.1 putative thiol-disulfide oxidoreductase [Gordonia araii NBRC 100433]
MIILVVVVAVFAALVGIAQLTAKDSPTADDEPAAQPSTSATTKVPRRPDELAVVRRDSGDPMAMGDVNAPVVLVNWTDLRCPYCAVFHREVLPVIETEYIKTGKVRLEVNDVAFFGEQSEKAAVAALAAADQGKYFEFTKAVYAEAPQKGHPDLPRDRLLYFAKKAGVPDLARFGKDLDREDLLVKVQETTAAAQGMSVPSVPFFVVGTSALAGAQPVETFRAYLDDVIKNAR